MAQAGKSGIWAAADGPYGSVHDLADYDKILLVAGGSGVTFALGLALNAMESHNTNVGVEKQQQEISLIWATRRIGKEFKPSNRNLLELIKNAEHTKWFDDHAKTLASSHNPRFCLTYFITGEPSKTTDSSVHSHQGSISLGNQEAIIDNESGVACKQKDSADTIILAADDTTRESFPAVRHQKLNLEEIVLEAVRLAGKDQRVLVACCGPNRMASDVRNAVAQCMTAEAPSITLLSESFSW
ncbi:hypothetical protein O1611_g9620 [Lasiodiplodia mahajangana]|uniref:Uncharacterized protein n=1 Tax=Lasiodiplodia mahajangana TaxID=1108764 RepID=A0ACC2J7D1_9PEZI|nr:hypothetical protein O1611_g9620 [Lasiodiplodia mahajangana]